MSRGRNRETGRSDRPAWPGSGSRSRPLDGAPPTAPPMKFLKVFTPAALLTRGSSTLKVLVMIPTGGSLGRRSRPAPAVRGDRSSRDALLGVAGTRGRISRSTITPAHTMTSEGEQMRQPSPVGPAVKAPERPALRPAGRCRPRRGRRSAGCRSSCRRARLRARPPGSRPDRSRTRSGPRTAVAPAAATRPPGAGVEAGAVRRWPDRRRRALCPSLVAARHSDVSRLRP